jgi:hypothetical protein
MCTTYSRIPHTPAYHILPQSIQDAGFKLWDALKLVFPGGEVDSWRRAFTRATCGGKNRLGNLITLTESFQRFHTEGASALRPVRVSDDKRELELEFHWLALERMKPNNRMLLPEKQPLTDRIATDHQRGYAGFRQQQQQKQEQEENKEGGRVHDH